MVLSRFVKGRFKALASRYQLAQTLSKPFLTNMLPINPLSWPESLQAPTEYYLNCVRYFHQAAPGFLKAHRNYFRQNNRGFGEDAFHVMWYALCNICKPSSFLEIGVYRGQVISLVSLTTRSLGFNCTVCGVSPFSDAGDSVSKYCAPVDYLEDALENFEFFKLPPPLLIKGLSTSTGVIERFSFRKWDLIYIDGNHEYEVAKGDFVHCEKVLAPGGKIVLDDSALGTAFKAPLYATAGHPGPSRLASELDSFGFREVLQVGHNRVFQREF